MIARRSLAQVFFPSISVRDYLGLQGLILSHAIGFALAVPFCLNRVLLYDLPYMRPVDVPLVFVAIWLVLDRRGRKGTLRLVLWDYLYLGFIAVSAFAYVYSDAQLIRLTSFFSYMDWSTAILKPYLYYLIIREGLNRRGFRPEIALYWLLGGLAVSAAIGVGQAANFPGIRNWSYNFYNQALSDRAVGYGADPGSARGSGAHPNHLAYQMWLGLALVVGVGWYRRTRVIDLLLGGLFFGALILSYSRSGVVTIAAMAAGLIVYLMIRKQLRAAFYTTVVCAVTAFVGILAIIALDVKRYKPLVLGESRVRRYEELGSYHYRIQMATKAVEVGMRSPFTGVHSVGAGVNNKRFLTRSAFAFEGVNDNMYSNTFVLHGVVGLIFLGGIVFALLRPVSQKWGGFAFSCALFLGGVGFAVHGNSDNLIFNDSMIILNTLMALVASGVMPVDVSDVKGRGWRALLAARVKGFV